MKHILLLIFLLYTFEIYGHSDANIFGVVKSKGEHLKYVTIEIPTLAKMTGTDGTGHFKFINLEPSEYKIIAKIIGYEPEEKLVLVEQGKTIEVNFNLVEKSTYTKEVVVTGTRNKQSITESVVKVDVFNSTKIENVQANNLSESLNYIPGIRLEVDCQTCNFSQLRMNGLGGAYSQVLINGKSLFSPLTGLYGLEQIPSNMIEKIEVVKGGASALYGSSSIAGTVNIITKTPDENSYSVSSISQLFDKNTFDNQLFGNLSIMNENRSSGLSVFVSKREREAVDINNDGFSELPKIGNNSFGFNAYIRPNFNHKIDLNFNSLYEYRRGGDKINASAHEALQSEERVHNIFVTGLEYEYFFNDFHSSISSYLGLQATTRKHYTGIIPDIVDGDSSLFFAHYFNPPYGNTENSTIQTGFKMNHYTDKSNYGIFDFSIGLDYLYDDVYDIIPSYNYLIDQTTHEIGIFGQVDWKVSHHFKILSGMKINKHNFVDKFIINPRISILWEFFHDFQFRSSWSTGFRAPQAFDADMHIAFSGGGIQKINLAENLKEENSQSLSSSISYDIFETDYAFGFTIDGFYTSLKDVFVLEKIANQGNFSVLEKRNGGNSSVFGGTFEIRVNLQNLLQIDLGITHQKSEFDIPVKWSTELPGSKDFLRTPADYGFLTLSYDIDNIGINFSSVYTGSMLVPHYGVSGDLGTPENDILKKSQPFFDMGIKLSYKLNIPSLLIDIEFFTGVKNILNSYQNDFDKGKFRDSGYIYGPALPRTIYLGLKFGQ